MSTSAQFGVANGFTSLSGMDGSTTMLCILNPKHYNSEAHFIDVSWLSKYPQEAEMVMGRIYGTAIFSPKDFYCKCELLTECSHAKGRYRNGAKRITIDPSKPEILNEKRRTYFMTTFEKRVVVRFKKRLEKHKSLFFSFFIFCSCVYWNVCVFL